MAKVRIFHEWLDTIGGAEAVLIDLIKLYPDAEIYTLWAEDHVLETLEISANTSFLQFFPKKLRRILGLPLMPIAWRMLSKSISDDDLSITSSWVFAHSAIPKKYEHRSIHFIHTPARYWWNPEIDSRTRLPIPNLVFWVLRKIDTRIAKNHLNVLANSNATKERIAKSWKLKSEVVHPGVDIIFYDYQKVLDLSYRKNFILCVGRFVPYKGHETAIKLGEYLNLPVVLVGHGKMEQYLKRLANKSLVRIDVLVNPSREILRSLYSNCFFLAYPAVEDFGIVPVEAMACGAQVLGISKGGLLDSITSKELGVLVTDQEIDTLVDGFHRITWESRDIVREFSLKFSNEKFRINLSNYVCKILKL
jgi:glycosyltransferase involved in cell wall biosynthesis